MKAVCADHGPGFAGTPAAIAALGGRQIERGPNGTGYRLPGGDTVALVRHGIGMQCGYYTHSPATMPALTQVLTATPGLQPTKAVENILTPQGNVVFPNTYLTADRKTMVRVSPMPGVGTTIFLVESSNSLPRALW